MGIFSADERRFTTALARLAHANPFLPERIDAEREALGRQFDERHADWNLRPDHQYGHPNVDRLIDRAARVAAQAHRRLERGDNFADGEAEQYDDLLLFFAFHRHRGALDQLIAAGGSAKSGRTMRAYRELADEVTPLLIVRGEARPLVALLPHAFACFFQIRRAYKNIFDCIIGVSRPAIRLRAAVWQSIFTHDMRRYRRLLYRQMNDYTTLVTGPSGTGKELVARAIGLSRYIPFDAKTGQFAEDFSGSFFAINLSAFSPTLIESELFGHRRGAYTGAIADREGWLDVCPEYGAVFLDEIGEVDAEIQVKLLRVLQTREFSRLGETQTRRFRGKLIAATNRELLLEMQRGRFREDLYYRLCSDVVAAPSLAERLTDSPEELPHLVRHLAERLVGDEADVVVDEVLATIARDLGPDYAWPGNVRELEQCVRNVLVRREYRPAGRQGTASPHGARVGDREGRYNVPGKAGVVDETKMPAGSAIREIARSLELGDVTADELLRKYCTLVYSQTRNYEAAAQRLQIDRRTVKAKVDRALLERLCTERNSK